MMTGNQFAGCGWVMTKNPRIGTAKAAATTLAKIAASKTRGDSTRLRSWHSPEVADGGG
jgi:hypothetical protein